MALVSASETDRSKPKIFLSIQIPVLGQDQVRTKLRIKQRIIHHCFYHFLEDFLLLLTDERNHEPK